MRPQHITKYFFILLVFLFLINSSLFAAAPTDIDLSSSSVDENEPINTVVGTLTSVDPDGDTDFTYTLVSGPGSTDNASFNISGDQLRTSETFDFETKSSYSIRIRTDDGTATYSESFIITINDINEAPTDITLSSNTIDENLPVFSLIGTLSTTDPDGDVLFTYNLVAGPGGSDNGSFNIVGNQLRTSQIFDFETKPTYSIRIRTSDGSLTYEEVFTINVNDVNEEPTDIALSSQEVMENQPINTVVGTLSSVDPDGDLSFTYSLVSGTGDTDNGSFNISGNQLRTSAVLDSDVKPSCQIRIRSTDGGGLYYEEQFTITVTDINEPPVLSGIEGSPLPYTEEDPAVQITSTLSVNDPENDNLASAEVSITGGFDADEDRLSLVSLIFSVNYNTGTGILTITGTGTENQYRDALRNVRYVNINDRDPSEANRTIQFIVNDGTQNSNAVTRTIQVTGENDAPDVQDDAYGGVLEGGTLIINVANGVLDNDEDLDGPAAMTATLQDDVQFGNLFFNSNGSFTYQHGGTSDLVDGFTYYASDSEDNSLIATVTITVIGANDPPELNNMESSVLQYTEDDPPRQITAAVTVFDEDNLTLQSAQISIDNNFVSSEDLLSYTSNPSLTINYTPASGIINVSGEATLLIYQNFLRSIRYVNTNTLNPSPVTRRVTFTVNDGTNSSVPVFRYIQILQQNDPPVATDATLTGSNYFIGEVLNIDYTYTDPDGDLEGPTTFRWYMAEDNQGNGRTLINTSQKDTLTPQFEHGGEWIQGVVRPFDINGAEGVYDTTEFRYINAAPVLNNFKVVNEIHPGAFAVDEVVNADFNYFDIESNPQGSHTFQWYRSATGQWTNKQAISGATDEDYTISIADNNLYISLEAVAYATAGSSPGEVQQSQWHLVSETPSAVISGDIEICDGSSDYLTVTLTGNNPPWSFRYVIEGTTDTIPVNNIPALQSDYQLEVTDSGTYLLVDVSDQEFDFGIVTGTGSVSYFENPAAELTVDELSICDNDVGLYTMPVMLTGNAPWSISYQIVGEPDSSFISNIDTAYADIEFTVDDIGTYQLLHVWDANCMAVGTGSTDVILRENPRATISGDTIVCPGDTALIKVDLSGNGPWTFTYTIDDGDEIDVDVDESVPSFTHIMDVIQAGVYRLTRVVNADDEGCAYGATTINNHVQPTATIAGEITICEGTSTDIPVILTGTSPWDLTYKQNIQDTIDIESITQNPYLLHVTEGGTYSIIEVTDGNNCTGGGIGLAEITENPAPEVSIVNLQTIYTVESAPIPLIVDPEGGDFDLSDPGVLFFNDTWNFLPLFAGTENSPHRVIYSYQNDTTGCYGRDTVIVNVLDEGGVINVRGEIDESPERYCFNQDTLILEGINQGLSVGEFSISGSDDSALINFDDNLAYLIPSRILKGTRIVTYSYEISGQPDFVTRNFTFELIEADFTWDNECFTDETLVTLSDNTIILPDDSKVDSNKWWITYPDHIFEADTTVLDLSFDVLDTYPIEYVVISEYGCSDTAKRPLVLKPTYPVYEDPYFEDFSDDESDWEVKSLIPEGPVSWTYGAPTGNVFNAPEESAWYTHIENDSLQESSYIISPCFDFSDAKRPMIKMDIWRGFVTNLDGAKLQYQTDSTPNWFPLGAVDKGIGWYNSNNILGLPGGSSNGWTSPANNWETAKHKLDDIPTDEGLVRFRIAYGESLNMYVPHNGIAVDNIWIGERTKRVLIEHFTNMGVDTTIKKVNSDFNEIVNPRALDIIDIQYHMDRPGVDTFYTLNNQIAHSRDLFYSLPNVPYSIIDGGRGIIPNQHEFLIDYRSEELDESDLDKAVLEENKFDIDISTTKSDDYVNIDVSVTALESMGQKYITIHVVIIEKVIRDVVSSFGESTFESVARAMLPSAIGTPHDINWSAGTSREINLDYYFQDIFDEDEVYIVAFVQDNDSREVYQAEIKPADPAMGINDKPVNKYQAFLMYPNPANEYTNIEFREPVFEKSLLQIVDNSGRLLRIVEMNSGEQMQSLILTEFDPGMYLIRLLRDDEIIGVQKLLILSNN